jgi:hypothetical protein
LSTKEFDQAFTFLEGTTTTSFSIGWFPRDMNIGAHSSVIRRLAILLIGGVMWACEKQSVADSEPASETNTKVRRPEAPEEEAPPLPDRSHIREMLKTADQQDLRNLKGDLLLLAKHDPKGCLAIMDELSPGSVRNSALRQVIAAFPPDRTGELVLWADQSDFDEDRGFMRAALAPARTDLTCEEATDLFGRAKASETREALLAYTALEAVDRGYSSSEQARRFANGLPEDARPEFMGNFLAALGAADMPRAVSEAIDNPDAYSGQARRACLVQAGVRSPGKVSELVLKVARKSGDASVVVPFVNGWLQSDSMAAGEWISANLSGECRDRAAAEVVRFLTSQGDVESSKPWRDSITADEIRNQLPD